MVLPWLMPKSPAFSLTFGASAFQLVPVLDASSDDHVLAVPDGAGVEGEVVGADEVVDAVSPVGIVGAPVVLLVLDPGMPCHCSTGGITPMTPIWSG